MKRRLSIEPLEARLNPADVGISGGVWEPIADGGGVTYTTTATDLGNATVETKAFWSTNATLSGALGDAIFTSNTFSTGDQRLEHIDFVEGRRSAPATATHLIVVLDPGNSLAETDKTNNLRAFELFPIVVTMSTHGYNPEGDPFATTFQPTGGTWTDFRERFFEISDDFRSTIAYPDSALAGRIDSMTAEWNSTTGFTQAVAFGVLAAAFSKATYLPLSSAQLTQYSTAFSQLATLWSAVSRVYSDEAALVAAGRIVEKLLPPVLSNELQTVVLVGHSRGGNVNAGVARILNDLGYTNVQYIGLDGFSGDWNYPASLLLEIPIVGVPGDDVVNYRVEDGFVDYAVNAVLDYLGGIVGPILKPILDPLFTAALGDFRAPDRAGMQNLALNTADNGPSYHVTIVNNYLDSLNFTDRTRQYILDNYVGWNRAVGTTPGKYPVPLQQGQFSTVDASPVLGTIVPTTNAFTPANAANLFSGNFEFANRTIQSLDDLNASFNTVLSELVDTLVGDLLSSSIAGIGWTATGDVAFNSAATLTQTANTSIAQQVVFNGAATTVAFDLNVTATGANDTLIVSLGNTVLSTTPLAVGASSITVPVPAGTPGGTTLTFALGGPVADASVVQLDNIRFAAAANNAPWAAGREYTVTPGGSLAVNASGGVLATAFDAENSPLTATVVSNPNAGTLVLNTDGSFTYTPDTGFTGFDSFTYTVSDGTLTSPVVKVVLHVVSASAELNLVSQGSGQSGRVNLLYPDGSPRFRLEPFAGFTGEIRTAAADFDGDGVDDLAVASGPGFAGTVRVYNGIDQSTMFDVTPFGVEFTRGVLLGAGDLTNDGAAELVITADSGGGARVRIFRYSNGQFRQTTDFIALQGADGAPDTSFRGGSSATVGDFNGDGFGDLAFAAGAGGGPRIALFDGKLLGETGGPKLRGDFFAFEPVLRNGATLAAGDFDGDGKDELVTAAGLGGAPRVRIFNPTSLFGNLISLVDFFAGDTTTRGGVRVTAKDLNGDGRDDLITGSGPDSTRTIAYRSGNPLTTLFDYAAFSGETNGVFVG